MLTFDRVFSKLESDPVSKRTIAITDDSGKTVFEQNDVEAPSTWSDLAVKVVASKYFYGQRGSAERENSIYAVVHRVVKTITAWGIEDGYFDEYQGNIFFAELYSLIIHQFGVFNSPVWFNVGLWQEYKVGGQTQGNWRWKASERTAERCPTQYESPQCSACFIQRVEDNMESILQLAYQEAMLFKFGSGTGTNLSSIRSHRETLSGGGSPSGPLSFLRIYDQVANVVKSGGKTRRAAKMNILDDWHPDVEEFIEAKLKEEKKAHTLIDGGYDGSFNGEAYGSVAYQNENLSVRATDKFMQAATDGSGEWWTYAVQSGAQVEKKDARALLRKIAEGTWFCGDPGMQFVDTIDKWHTCQGTGPIRATNPCSEYVFLDETACNLASLNLLKFRDDQSFNTTWFEHAVRLFITAQEILVDRASYPTPAITINSHIFRTLGLGYANLGALVMSYGLPYDSDKARRLAASISALMTGTAYHQSSLIALFKGSFEGLRNAQCFHVKKPILGSNVESMTRVLYAHMEAAKTLGQSIPEDELLAKHMATTATTRFDDSIRSGEWRNAQVTVVAPTGTIAFMMDCDTTGIEPDISLVKYKLLAGGGNLKYANQTVPMALELLGYNADEIKRILAHIEKFDTIEDVGDNASGIKPEHLAVFDCAFKPKRGRRSIHYKAHIKVMAAVQPFISGAISKTINMPTDSTVEEIMNAYVMSWKLGLKCVAIYRDGSKRSQPLTTGKRDKVDDDAVAALKEELEERKTEIQELWQRIDKLGGPVRKRLSDTRNSITHKFSIAGIEGYLTVGMFDDGSPGELFITMSKEGSTIGGLMDSVGTLTSIALQYGVPLDTLVSKFSFIRFEPQGFTSHPKIRQASSIIDYVFRWMGIEFLDAEEPTKEEPVANLIQATLTPVKKEPVVPAQRNAEFQIDAPLCGNCGHVTVRSGTCYRCNNCGSSQGCS